MIAKQKRIVEFYNQTANNDEAKVCKLEAEGHLVKELCAPNFPLNWYWAKLKCLDINLSLQFNSYDSETAALQTICNARNFIDLLLSFVRSSILNGFVDNSID